MLDSIRSMSEGPNHLFQLGHPCFLDRVTMSNRSPCSPTQVSGGFCHARYWPPSQAAHERSFARKQDHYYDCCGYDRHRDKIEDCPTFAEAFKNLWRRQKDKIVSMKKT